MPPEPVPLRQLALFFLRLGTTAFVSIGVVSVVLLFGTRIPPVLLVAAGALAGLLLRGL